MTADTPTLAGVALAALALGAASMKFGQMALGILRKRNGNDKSNIQLLVRDAVRIEIDKEKLATVYLLTEKHTLQITALERDVSDLKQK